MHTLTAVEFVSLDGVMQSPGRPDEDTTGGFTQGGWAFAHMATDPEAAQAALAGDADTVGMVFGHRTYDDLVGYWLATADPNPFADMLRSTPKYVTSRHGDTDLPHPNSTLLHGEAVESIARLKAEGEGDLILLGSAKLLHALQDADLIDGYILTQIPVIIGDGVRLFERPATPAQFRLVRGAVTEPGAFVGEYRRR